MINFTFNKESYDSTYGAVYYPDPMRLEININSAMSLPKFINHIRKYGMHDKKHPIKSKIEVREMIEVSQINLDLYSDQKKYYLDDEDEERYFIIDAAFADRPIAKGDRQIRVDGLELEEIKLGGRDIHCHYQNKTMMTPLGVIEKNVQDKYLVTIKKCLAGQFHSGRKTAPLYAYMAELADPEDFSENPPKSYHFVAVAANRSIYISQKFLMAIVEDCYGIMPQVRALYPEATAEELLQKSDKLEFLYNEKRSLRSEFQINKKGIETYLGLTPLQQDIFKNSGHPVDEYSEILNAISKMGKSYNQDYDNMLHKIWQFGRGHNSGYRMSADILSEVVLYPHLREAITGRGGDYLQYRVSSALLAVSPATLNSLLADKSQNTWQAVCENVSNLFYKLEDLYKETDPIYQIIERVEEEVSSKSELLEYREYEKLYKEAIVELAHKFNMDINIFANKSFRFYTLADYRERQMAELLKRSITASKEFVNVIKKGMYLYATNFKDMPGADSEYEKQKMLDAFYEEQAHKMYKEHSSITERLPMSDKFVAKEEKPFAEAFQAQYRGRYPQVIGAITAYANKKGMTPDEVVQKTSLASLSEAVRLGNESMIRLSMEGVNIQEMTEQTRETLSMVLTPEKYDNAVKIINWISSPENSLSIENLAYIIENAYASPILNRLEQRMYSKEELNEIFEGNIQENLLTDIKDNKMMFDLENIENYLDISLRGEDHKIAGWDTRVQVGSYEAVILPKHHADVYEAGEKTNCCMQIDGAAESCIIEAETNGYAGVLAVYDQRGQMAASAFVWTDEKTNTFVFDNIEFANDRDVRSQLAILEEYCKALPYKNVHMGMGYNQLTCIGKKIPQRELANPPFEEKEVYSDYGNDAVKLKENGEMLFCDSLPHPKPIITKKAFGH